MPSLSTPEDRWLSPWAVASAAVGGASLLVPLYALALGGDAVFVHRTSFAVSALAVLVAAALVGAWYPEQEEPFLSPGALLEAATVFPLFVASGATAISDAWTGTVVERGSTAGAHASALLVRGFALPAVPVAVAPTESVGALLTVYAVIGAAGRSSSSRRRSSSRGSRRRTGEGRPSVPSPALSRLGTAVGSAAGGAIPTAVGYGARFPVAVAVVVVGAGLSLLAWGRDH